MICKHITKGDKLTYTPELGWEINWQAGGYSRYPALNICVSPDVVFRANSEGYVSPLKSSLRKHKSRDCFDVLCNALGLVNTLDDEVFEKYDSDPNYTFSKHVRIG
jgi:hypothetical protein